MNICTKVQDNPCNSCWDVAEWTKQGSMLIKGQFRPYAWLSHAIVKICRRLWWIYIICIYVYGCDHSGCGEGLGDQGGKTNMSFSGTAVCWLSTCYLQEYFKLSGGLKQLISLEVNCHIFLCNSPHFLWLFGLCNHRGVCVYVCACLRAQHCQVFILFWGFLM